MATAAAATSQRKRSIFDDSDSDVDDPPTPPQEIVPTRHKEKEEVRGRRGRGRGIKKTRILNKEEDTAEIAEDVAPQHHKEKEGRRGRGRGRKKTRILNQEDNPTEVAEEGLIGDEDREPQPEEGGTQPEGGLSGHKMTSAEQAIAEQNRQMAIQRRREKANKQNPYLVDERAKTDEKVIRLNNTKLTDSGGGFFIEEDEESGVTREDMLAAIQIVSDPAPFLEEKDRPVCLCCRRQFHSSFLLDNFSYAACDHCRDPDDTHCLITRTDARNEYLLKDVDIDKREPPLRFIVRANPHNSAWGDMKLYLKLQVEQRALEVWGSEEALEEALQKKEELQQRNKQKRYNKKMKELRMSVRSSLYTRATKMHTHTYGDETYMEEEDTYKRTCTSCGHSYTYDKM